MDKQQFENGSGNATRKRHYLVEACYNTSNWVGGRRFKITATSADEAWDIACSRVRRRVPHAKIDEGTCEEMDSVSRA